MIFSFLGGAVGCVPFFFFLRFLLFLSPLDRRPISFAMSFFLSSSFRVSQSIDGSPSPLFSPLPLPFCSALISQDWIGPFFFFFPGKGRHEYVFLFPCFISFFFPLLSSVAPRLEEVKKSRGGVSLSLESRQKEEGEPSFPPPFLGAPSFFLLSRGSTLAAPRESIPFFSPLLLSFP